MILNHQNPKWKSDQNFLINLFILISINKCHCKHSKCKFHNLINKWVRLQFMISLHPISKFLKFKLSLWSLLIKIAQSQLKIWIRSLWEAEMNQSLLRNLDKFLLLLEYLFMLLTKDNQAQNIFDQQWCLFLQTQLFWKIARFHLD